MGPIYDCHVNVWDPEHYLPLYQEQLERVRPGGLLPKSDADTLARELSGAAKAILFSPRYGDSLGIQGADAATADAVARYPDRFVGFAYLDPREPAYMETLRRSIGEYGFKGVKYGPIYNGVGLGDERMEPVYAFCQENDLPLTLHMGTTFTVNSPIDCGRPLHVDPVALAYPDLKIIMAHMGHPWTAECTVIIRKNRNVYGEITGICYRPWIFYNSLAEIQDYTITDKFFFGTDFPFFTATPSNIGGTTACYDALRRRRLWRPEAAPGRGRCRLADRDGQAIRAMWRVSRSSRDAGSSSAPSPGSIAAGTQPPETGPLQTVRTASRSARSLSELRPQPDHPNPPRRFRALYHSGFRFPGRQAIPSKCSPCSFFLYR